MILKKFKINFFLTVLVFIFITGCGGSDNSTGSNGSDGSTYSISGAIMENSTALADVTVTLSGASNASTTTNALGIYSFTGLSNGAYTVTPSSTEYTFTPLSLSVTVSGADATDNNFSATASIIPDQKTITLGDPITYTGTGISVSGSTVTISDEGDYLVTGSLSDGMIYVDTTETVRIRLSGVSITHSTGPAICIGSAAKAYITLTSGTSNTLTDGETYSDTDFKGTIFSNDPLEIDGTGSLTVTGRYKHGIVSDDNLIISGGAITIASTVKDGFHANDDITVSGGTITTIQTGSDGMESEGTLEITGGILTLTVSDDGIISEDTLTINGGSITIISGVEGIESKNRIVVNGGEIDVTVSDDGLNATNDITINGGQLYFNATADAMDSNGTLNFNGGVTVALGGNAPEGALDCDSCTIAFNGGTVVATGGSNSTPSSSSTQRVVVFGTRPVDTFIHVQNGATDILTFKVTKAYQSMIFTSPSLAASTTYTAYSGGTVSGGTEFHGLYTGATYSGGSVWNTFTTNDVVTYVGGAP